ncbi:FtsX-like permease family protein [Modestobacter roseus]|uniref:Putative ABC transport system permease protein n=1 Tax=Modestobacter roseus TaxID=1181884 RepID=A0A562IXA2_9ACTN|nr:FtsX-like permease family protein [Modestobacter roseus]MQA32699.1 FtsX-like permease family protein [Modestobacter roseus]TWH75691.1 putative ABC transport system permease protein [Modestobacter roseus]
MSRPALWRLAPWTRAPLLGLRSAAAVVAVLVTTAILACAVASAPLFLSSARSAALQQQLAQRCAEVGWAQTGIGWALADPEDGTPLYGTDGQRPPVDQDLIDAWAERDRTAVPALGTATIGQSGVRAQSLLLAGPDGEPLSTLVTALHRPDLAEHLQLLDGDLDTPGLLLPRSVARGDALTAGDELAVGGVPLPVAGVYTDLAETPDDPYWCDYELLFLNEASANSAPPPVVLATDEATFYRLATATGGARRLQQVQVDPETLSVTDAEQLLTEQAEVQAVAEPEIARLGAQVAGPVLNDRMPDAIDRARLIERGLRGPVIPVAVAGALLALVLVASAGSFWADRRATEVRLLAARGVGPVPLAGKAALELGLPALAGAALGWAASRLLVARLGPADDLDPAATTAAVWAGVAAFVVGLAAASLVAGLRARGTAERPLGAAPRWPARVPWEVALLLAAAWCWLLLEGRDAVVDDAGVAQVNGLLVAFPLLAIAGAAALLARVLSAGLPRLRRWAGRRGPAVFLAVNRLSAARLATATLLVAVTLPVAVLGYTATLTASAQTTLDAKVGVQIGAEAAVTSLSRFAPTTGIDAVGTLVERYEADAVEPDGSRVDVQVLGVDPDTFAGTAFWDESFADRPLADLVAELTGPAVDGRLPVVAAGLPTGDPGLRLGRMELPAQVVATAQVLPGRRIDGPVVLVDADRLPDVPREAGAERRAEVWTNDDPDAAVTALVDAGGARNRTLTPPLVLNTANFLGITWTFGYLSALAVFVGVIAVGGLLLYLEARSRTRVSGYVMARRLGLTRAAHLRSLLVELAGVAVAGVLLGAVLAAGAVALVYRRLDVDLLRPPTPLLDVPWAAAAGTAAVVLAVAGLAALYAQRAADRADPATVLRQDA